MVRRGSGPCMPKEARILPSGPSTGTATPTMPSIDENLSLDVETRGKFEKVVEQIESLDRACLLKDLPRRADEIRASLEDLVGPAPEFSANGHGEAPGVEKSSAGPRELWLTLIDMFDASARQSAALLQNLDALALQCGEFANMAAATGPSRLPTRNFAARSSSEP